MFAYLVDKYVAEMGLEAKPVRETPPTGCLHPDYDGYFASPQDYMRCADTLLTHPLGVRTVLLPHCRAFNTGGFAACVPSAITRLHASCHFYILRSCM